MAEGRFCFHENNWGRRTLCRVSNSRSWWSFQRVWVGQSSAAYSAITEMDALMLNYWLSKFVQEMAKCCKDPYPPKTLYQIVCGIRQFMVEKNPTIRFSPLDSSDKRCVNWCYWRGGPFDISKLKQIASNFSLFLIRFAILRRIWDTEMKNQGLELALVWKRRKKCTVNFNSNWLELVSL